MMPSLKKLIILALFASLGLVFLQAFWLAHEWKRDKEVIARQATTALKEAVHKELETRKDSLRQYLTQILNDTSLFTFSTLYLPKHKVWSVKMADASNPNDYTNWTNSKIPVGPVLTSSEKQAIIQNMIRDHVDRNTVMYYTQRLGSRWKARYDSLRLNDAALRDMFEKQLAAVHLFSSFTLHYIDTTVSRGLAQQPGGKISTQAIGIQYKTVWDNDQSHIVLAEINNPFILLLKRLWLTITATFLLLMLTLYCMYRMYSIIRHQKQLADIKNDFISNITHELKTPLATVGAAIDALQYFEGWNDKERKEKYLNTSRTEIQKLNGLLSQIMDAALYEKGGPQLHKEWINISELLHEVAAAISIQYTTELDYTVTKDTERTHILADRNHFAGVIKNILENAVKYHPDKQNIRLEISVTEKENNTVIHVKDNGPGIAQEHQPFLFDKFYRVPQHNGHNVKGFGLGLYYVRKIIDAHNGTVTLFSRQHEGTTVSVQLPLPDGA